MKIQQHPDTTTTNEQETKSDREATRPDQTRPGDDRDDELREVLEEHVREELPAEPDVLEPAQRVALFFWPFGDRNQDRARSEERATTYCCGGSTNVRGRCGEERVVPGKILGLSGTYSDTGFKSFRDTARSSDENPCARELPGSTCSPES